MIARTTADTLSLIPGVATEKEPDYMVQVLLMCHLIAVMLCFHVSFPTQLTRKVKSAAWSFLDKNFVLVSNSDSSRRLTVITEK